MDTVYDVLPTSVLHTTANKGAGTHAVDPESPTEVALFNPRQQHRCLYPVQWMRAVNQREYAMSGKGELNQESADCQRRDGLLAS